jgi:hypothetical protein
MEDCRAKGRDNKRRGEASGASKLKEAAVLEIVRRIRAGHQKRQIAQDFGVSARSIGYIAAGKTWSWLTGLAEISASAPPSAGASGA